MRSTFPWLVALSKHQSQFENDKENEYEAVLLCIVFVIRFFSVVVVRSEINLQSYIVNEGEGEFFLWNGVCVRTIETPVGNV